MDHLSSLAQYQNAVNTGSSLSNGKVNTTNTTSQNTSSVQQNVDQLKAGDTISGQVVESDGLNVKIAINENYVIQAKLEQELSLISGKNMLFEVKGNSGSQVSLSPLFANMAGEANAEKALNAANLPINQNTMKLVAALMDEGMSIDKNTLSQVYRQEIQNPDASQSAILQLNKMEVPVNADNLQQLDLYLNYKHQLLQGIEDVAGQIPELYEALASSGDTERANLLMGKLLQIFGEAGPAISQSVDGMQIEDGLSNVTMMEGQEQVNANGSVTVNNGLASEGILTDPSEIQTELIKGAADDILQSLAEGGELENVAQQIAKDGLENMLPNENTQGMTSGTVDLSQNILTQLSPNQSSEIANLMKEMGISQETIQQFQSGDMNAEQFLQLVSQNLTENKMDPSTAAKLIRTEGFQKLFQSEVTKQWLLQPEDIKREGVVDRFYERLREQTSKMSQLLEQAGQGDSSLSKSVQNIRSNVNFMNDLNHMFTYVQLPLKFSESKAHGDLYVYTNKKSLARDTGEVSALLHLDMEHLGQMDVHVKLTKGEKVATKFYVADDSILDFISEHIDMLNERLESRGYQASANFEVRNESKNVMEEMVSSGDKPTLLATQSFDARA